MNSASKIAPKDWEDHKSVIYDLYISDDRKLLGDDGVIEAMKAQGFVASKGQYERQLKKWGFRKYESRQQWLHILARVNERKRHGMRSEVFVNGKAVSQRRLKKEASRYVSELASFQSEINTAVPRCSHTWIVASPKSDEMGISIDEDRSAQLVDVALTEDMASNNCTDSPKLPASIIFHPTLNSELTPDVHGARLQNRNDQSPSSQSSVDESELCVETKEMLFAVSQSLKDLTHFSDNFLAVFFPSFEELTIQNTCSPLSALMPILEDLTQIRSHSGIPIRSTDIELGTATFLFFFANDYLHEDPTHPIDDERFFQKNLELDKTLAHIGISDILRNERLNAHIKKSGYMEAALTGIFRQAIQSHDPTAIDELFNAGVTVLQFRDRAHSLLLYASYFHNFYATEQLINANADVRGPEGYGSTLLKNWIVGTEYSRMIQDMNSSIFDNDIADAFQLLLKNGASLCGSSANGPVLALVRAVSSNNPRLVRVILDVYQSSFSDNAIKTFLQRALQPDYSIFAQDPAKFTEEVTIPILQVLPLHKISLDEEIWVESALELDSVEVIEVLLLAGAPFSSQSLVKLCDKHDQTFVRSCLQLAVKHSINLFTSDSKLPIYGIGSNLIISANIANAMKMPTRLKCLQRLFLSAVRLRDIRACKSLIAFGVDIDSKEPMLPILLACQSTPNLAGLLLQHGASVLFPLHINSTLWLAVMLSKSGLVKKALAFGASLRENVQESPKELDPTQTIFNFPSVIFEAINRDEPEILEILLGSDQYYHLEEDMRNLDYFSLAARTRNLKAMQILLRKIGGSFTKVYRNDTYKSRKHLEPSRYEKFSFRGRFASPLVEAILSTDESIISILLDAEIDVNYVSRGSRHETAIEASVDANDLPLMVRLLERGADPADQRALKIAVKKGDESHKIVEALLCSWKSRSSGNLPYFAGEALCNAITMGCKRLTSLLLDNNVPLKLPLGNGTGQSELITLLHNERHIDKNTMDCFVRGANCHYADFNVLYTALGAAAVLRLEADTRMFATKELLRCGADIDGRTTNARGMTPIQAAALHGRMDSVVLLLDLGADVNAPAALDSGGTALQFAAMKGFVGIAAKLIKAGAHVNAPGSKVNGMTALESAAANGRFSMVWILVGAGATIVGDGSKQYARAVQLAEEKHHLAVSRLLEYLRAEQRYSAVELLPSRHHGT